MGSIRFPSPLAASPSWPRDASTSPSSLLVRKARNLARCGAAVGIGVGGTFDYLTGVVRRAPAWVRRAGLEWLYRLLRQPWRWRRQLALPHFAALVLAQRLSDG